MVSLALNRDANRLGVALVGAGRWGRVWLSTIERHPDIDFRWVCDSLPPSDENGGARARWCRDVDRILDDDLVSAVVLATPIETHADLGHRIVAAGRHALIEKPVATDTGSLTALLDTARVKDVRVMVNHLLLFHPAFAELCQRLQAGDIGEPHSFFAIRTSIGQGRADCPWWTLAPHDLALLERLAPELLGAPLVLTEHDGETQARLDDDRKSAVFVSATCGERKVRLFVVAGNRGSLVFDDAQLEKLWYHPRPVDLSELHGRLDERWLRSRLGFGQPLPCSGETPLDRSLRHFVDCIGDRREPISGSEHALAVTLALERGRPFFVSRHAPSLEVIA